MLTVSQERWRQIEALYQAARSVAPEQRAAFLAGISPELRGELQKVLDAGEEASLETVAPTVTMAGSMAAGKMVGPYRIDGSLGQGGMG